MMMMKNFQVLLLVLISSRTWIFLTFTHSSVYMSLFYHCLSTVITLSFFSHIKWLADAVDGGTESRFTLVFDYKINGVLH
jgi:hypothetical protein